MAVFFVSGVPIELDATRYTAIASQCPDAWQSGEYMTVRMTADGVDIGVRAHTNARDYPGRPASNAAGKWLALDDVIATAHTFAASRALPGVFTHVGWVTLPAGCVINIGMAAPKFGYRGGGVQAEYLQGPRPIFDQAVGKVWHGVTGHA